MQKNYNIVLKKEFQSQNNMKEIVINSTPLQYKTVYDTSEHGETARTEFFSGITTVTKKKWIFYGPTYEETVPKKIFTIWADTQDPSLSKDWWRSEILKQLAKFERIKELEKGELI